MSRQFIDNNGALITASSDEEAGIWLKNGIAPADESAILHAKVKASFSGWADKAAAFSLGVVGAIPGATTALTYAGAGLRSVVQGQPFAQALSETGQLMHGAQDANPALAGVGTVAGLGATVLASGGAALAARGAGAGAQALAAAKVVGTGAAAGIGYTADDLAVQHALTGHGSEKIFSEMAQGALFGGALNLGFAAAIPAGLKAFTRLKGAAGEASNAIAQSADEMAQRTIMTQRAIEKLSDAGRNPEVIEYMSMRKMWNMTQAEVKVAAKEDMAKAQGLFKEARFSDDAVMDLQGQIGLINDLQKLTQGMDPTVARAALKGLDPGKAASLGRLHDARQAVDKLADYEKAAGPYTRSLVAVRDRLNSSIDDLLTASGNGPRANAWRDANTLFRTSAAVKQGLATAEQEGSSFWKFAVTGAGVAAGGAAANEVGASPTIGAGLGGLAGGAVAAGVFTPGGRSKLGIKAMRALSDVLHGFDNRAAAVVVQRLGGSSAAPLAISEAALHVDHYDKVAPMLQMVSQNPQQTTTDYVAALEAHGVPGPVQDQLVAKQQLATQFLSSLTPQSPYAGGTVAPTRSQPTRQQKQMFMQGAEAIRDPIGALRNPTPTGLAAVKAVYPEVHADFQRVVGEHVAQRGNLSPKARKWAGQILGMPGDNMALPGPQQMLRQIDAMRQAAAQQQAQQNGGARGGRPTGGGGSAIISQTQSERLSK